MALEPPPLLVDLIERGEWAETTFVDDRFSVDLVRQWDPNATGIHLLARLEVLANVSFPGMEDLWNLTDVDPERCVIIADFSLGTDNVVVLDYSTEPAAVRTMRWDPNCRWIVIAHSFDEFAQALGFAVN